MAKKQTKIIPRPQHPWKATVVFALFLSAVVFLYVKFPNACDSALAKVMHIPFTQIMLFAMLAFAARILWLAQTDPDINLNDIIKGLDGKASGPKIQGNVAFCIASWVVIESRIVGSISWELIALLVLYAAIYVANPIAVGVISIWAKVKGVSFDPTIPSAPPPPPLKTTTTTTPEGQVETKTEPVVPPAAP